VNCGAADTKLTPPHAAMSAAQHTNRVVIDHKRLVVTSNPRAIDDRVFCWLM
jgi:hypothetical protein